LLPIHARPFSIPLGEVRDNRSLPLYVDVGECVFPEAGLYTFEIYFSAQGGEALKEEHPFTVLSREE
jgi:hypothetical protein